MVFMIWLGMSGNGQIAGGADLLPIVSAAVVVGPTTQAPCPPGLVPPTPIPLLAATISGFVVLFRKYFYLLNFALFPFTLFSSPVK